MKPSSSPPPPKPMGLIQRLPEDDDNETDSQPLEWGLIRRLFTYTTPIKRKVTALIILSFILDVYVNYLTS